MITPLKKKAPILSGFVYSLIALWTDNI